MPLVTTGYTLTNLVLMLRLLRGAICEATGVQSPE